MWSLKALDGMPAPRSGARPRWWWWTIEFVELQATAGHGHQGDSPDGGPARVSRASPQGSPSSFRPACSLVRQRSTLMCSTSETANVTLRQKLALV